MAYPFTGQLNQNTITTSIFNMIISQRIYDIKLIGYNDLVESIKVDGTLYGDTKLYYMTDVSGTRNWLNDGEADSLLKLNRNKTTVSQSIVLNNFRQTDVTIDNYLSKRAFLDEGTFVTFNGVILTTLGLNKKVYEMGYVNTTIGSLTDSVASNSITLTLPVADDDSTDVEIEAISRRRAQLIAARISKLAREMKDVSRQFNALKYLRSYDVADAKVVWNGDYVDEITLLDLPTIFNKAGLEPNVGSTLPAKYFGNVKSGTSGAAGDVALEELYGVVTAGKATYTTDIPANYNQLGSGFSHVFPGETLPTVAGDGTTEITQWTVPAKSLLTPDPKIICKIVFPESLPFMGAFETATMFNNPRSLTDNHYLTWGYNTLELIKEFPLITIKEA